MTSKQPTLLPTGPPPVSADHGAQQSSSRSHMRRQMTHNACVGCRRKRSKCDGQSPCCGCVARGEPCDYKARATVSKSELRSEIAALRRDRRDDRRFLNALLLDDHESIVRRFRCGEPLHDIAESLTKSPNGGDDSDGDDGQAARDGKAGGSAARGVASSESPPKGRALLTPMDTPVHGDTYRPVDDGGRPFEDRLDTDMDTVDSASRSNSLPTVSTAEGARQRQAMSSAITLEPEQQQQQQQQQQLDSAQFTNSHYFEHLNWQDPSAVSGMSSSFGAMHQPNDGFMQRPDAHEQQGLGQQGLGQHGLYQQGLEQPGMQQQQDLTSVQASWWNDSLRFSSVDQLSSQGFALSDDTNQLLYTGYGDGNNNSNDGTLPTGAYDTGGVPGDGNMDPGYNDYSQQGSGMQ